MKISTTISLPFYVVSVVSLWFKKCFLKNHNGTTITTFMVRTATAITALMMCPALALADGGTLRLSQPIGDVRISVFTAPAVLRVGTIDISVLAQDAKTGAIMRDPTIRIRLECTDRSAIPLEQEATFAAATNKLFRAAQFDVPEAGNWRANVALGEPAQSVSVPISIDPPLPAWVELAPWIGWPFAVVALYFVHRAFVARATANRQASRTIAPGRTIVRGSGYGPAKA
jgi:hypothetical protein